MLQSDDKFKCLWISQLCQHSYNHLWQEVTRPCLVLWTNLRVWHSISSVRTDGFITRVHVTISPKLRYCLKCLCTIHCRSHRRRPPGPRLVSSATSFTRQPASRCQNLQRPTHSWLRSTPTSQRPGTLSMLTCKLHFFKRHSLNSQYLYLLLKVDRRNSEAWGYQMVLGWWQPYRPEVILLKCRHIFISVLFVPVFKT